MSTTFAWCFSHGRMHCFLAEPWCTAAWVRLPGRTEDEAEAAATARWGGARFLDDLSLEEQVEVLSEVD